MSAINGTYLKGKGYTPIYVCATFHSGYEYPLTINGAGLSFETAMEYAETVINSYLNKTAPGGGNVWDIDVENENGDNYQCVLISKFNYENVVIRVSKCALMHS